MKKITAFILILSALLLVLSATACAPQSAKISVDGAAEIRLSSGSTREQITNANGTVPTEKSFSPSSRTPRDVNFTSKSLFPTAIT